MNTLSMSIESFQECIFEYRAAKIAEAFLAMINSLEGLADRIEEEKRPVFNHILHLILTAYQNKDYLLVADLAKYELEPLALQAQSREKQYVAL